MPRTVLTPTTKSQATADGKLAFWKQILPKRDIHYTAKDGSRQVAHFTDEYLTDLAQMKGIDKIGFMLADTDNRHTMDPERWRGDVTAMEVRDDGLYGRIEFPDATMAQAVLANPNLGVSARIREGIPTNDGGSVSRGIIHVLGTLDPQVAGMSPWVPTDLANNDDDLLDLSTGTYEEGITMKPINEITEADIDSMSDAEVDAFLNGIGVNFSGTVDDTEEDEYDSDSSDDDLEDEDADKRELVGAGAELSAVSTRDIELANSAAAAAGARANEALRRMAAAAWRGERNELQGAGVPPAMLDLAEPILNRADDMVIDLSNTGDENVNASEIVRGLLDALKGTVDLSNEAGHSGSFTAGDGEDPDAAELALWAKMNV